ncbi:MAG: TRAP transporter small permease subunit [Pseudomonadota bacterium]
MWRTLSSYHAHAVNALAVAAGILLVVITGLLCLDVFVRYAQIAAITWIGESAQYALYAVTFLAAPWALERGRHVSIEMLAAALPPKAAAAVSRVVGLIGAAVCLVLLVYAVRVLGASFDAGTMVFRTMIFPQWYLFVVPPPVFLLLSITFLKQALGVTHPSIAGMRD